MCEENKQNEWEETVKLLQQASSKPVSLITYDTKLGNKLLDLETNFITVYAFIIHIQLLVMGHYVHAIVSTHILPKLCSTCLKPKEHRVKNL